MTHPNERGMAMIVAIFMVLISSVIGVSLMSVAQTETRSSQNYRLMSQARYGAESAIHRAAHHLMNAYAAPAASSATDPLSNYNTTVSPVVLNMLPVVLSSHPEFASNYPTSAVAKVNAFALAAQGEFQLGDANVDYYAVAELKSMRTIPDVVLGQDVTLQTWEITGQGLVEGALESTVEVAATLEVQPMSIYAYAVFATNNGCGALSFAGGAVTNSYDSTQYSGSGPPTLSNTDGNVGTNGNLTEVGNPTTINGSLSTPRSGVGACTSNNVTAQTVTGQASVTGGLNQLSQPVKFPSPPTINPPALTTDQHFTQSGGCPVTITSGCTVSTNGATLTPTSGTPMQMGNIELNGSAVLVLNEGTYHINSLQMNGSSRIVTNGRVTIKVAGDDPVTTPIKINGNGISNTTYDPQNLQFIYGGDKSILLAGGEETAAVFYMPNATASISGGADIYGAMVVKTLTATGGSAIHYDRNLRKGGETAGPWMLSAFTWKSAYN
jgi:hypothetical protein